MALSAVPDVPLDPTELGVLADVTLGAAVRARAGTDRRLATMSMTVDLACPAPRMSQVSAYATQVAGGSSTGETAVAAGTLCADGTAIGSMSAAFSLRDDGLPLIPWEMARSPQPAELSEADLTVEETSAFATVVGSDAAAGTALVRAATVDGAGDSSSLRPGPLLANRAGAVQGGAVLGFAAHAAEPRSGAALLSVHVEFLSPALITSELVAAVTVLRDGRRQRVARVDLLQSGTAVATAIFRHGKGTEA